MLAALLPGCHSNKALKSAADKPADPAILLQSIRSDFLHANLDVAGARAHQARVQFADRPDWSLQFRLLEAEILTYQGRRPAVLSLLCTTDVSNSLSGDSAIKKDLLCGLAHAGLGQSRQSQQYLQNARYLADLTHSGLEGEVLQAEAKFAFIQNHLQEAENLYRSSQKVAHAHGDVFLESRDSLALGLLAIDDQHYDDAVVLLSNAATLAEQTHVHLVIEAALGNLGLAYFYLGDFDKALPYFQQALEESKNIGTTSAQVDWLWDIGTTNYELGNLPAAKSCYEQSLKVAEQIHSPDEIIGIASQLSLALYQEGKYDAARVRSDEAVNAAQSSPDPTSRLWPLFIQALLAAKSGSPQAQEMLLQVDHQARQLPALQWEVENELAKFYASHSQNIPAVHWYQKSISTFETQRSHVSGEELKLPFFANGEGLYKDYADFLISINQPEKALQLLDLGRARTLRDGLGLAPRSSRNQINPQQLAHQLQAVILFYSLDTSKSYLWAITGKRTRIILLPGSEELNALVQQHRKAILRSADLLRDGNSAGASLYDLLVAPASTVISKGSHVVIVPDGILNQLNFESLLAPGVAARHYWIEDVTLTNANSIQLIRTSRLTPPAAGSGKLLLIGNPIEPAPEYQNLANAADEVADIQKHFLSKNERVLTGAKAVPNAYADSNPGQYDYLHFVAHGIASRLSPLDSAVVLSAPREDALNFKLYARDIVHLPLHAQLVTISACNGSGLRAYAGEGLVGLSWAFMRAGAHTVIGALWEANDASTPMLMDRLYSGLDQGEAPEAALRAAKLSLIHSSTVYRKPLYWAAFQLYSGS